MATVIGKYEEHQESTELGPFNDSRLAESHELIRPNFGPMMQYWKNIVLLPLLHEIALLLLQRVVGENKVFLCTLVDINNTVVNYKRHGKGRLFLLHAHLGHQGHLRKRSGRRPCRSNTVEGQVIPVPEWLERLHLFTFLFL